MVKWYLSIPKNVLTDDQVKLSSNLSKKNSESFRLIRYYDEEDNREFTFLTNAKLTFALNLVNLYKKGSWAVYFYTAKAAP